MLTCPLWGWVFTVSAFGQSTSGIEQRGFAAQVAAAGQTAQPGPAQPVRRLSLDEAVKQALEQNLSIQVERLNPQIQDMTIAQASAFWAPNSFASVTNNNQSAPPDSLFSGATGTVTSNQARTQLGVRQGFQKTGGDVQVSWNTSRLTTNNIFNSFDPTLRSFVEVQFNQPLLQNYRIDQGRQQLLVTRKNRELSDIQFRQTVANTVRSVKNAYWDLVFAYSNLEAQQQSLELARRTLKDNRTRVEVGTMAPIDIVEAEAEVARNEESVIVAEAQIKSAEDRLRALIFDPAAPDFWNLTLEPTDKPNPSPVAVDVDGALRAALDKRTDLQSAKKSLERNDITLRYLRNQTLPQVNFNVTYNTEGLGGTELVRAATFPPGPVLGEVNRGLGSILGDVFRSKYPDWIVGFNVSYPIGRSAAEAGVARAKLEYSQVQTQIRSIELQVGTQIRDLGRQVNTNLKRVEATRAARQLSEKRLEAEQKKFSVGLSTSFQVFQAQRDLGQARNNEIRAILDYNKSLVDFEAVQETNISGSGIVVGSSSASTGTASSTTGQQQQQ
ncbi:MAG: TolC family protein [Vicinamibacterales bacterium]